MNDKAKLLLAAIASASLAACQQGGGEANQAATADRAGSASAGGGTPAAVPGNQTIAQTITGSADHSTLLNALKSAGLVETLSGAGPYTVFAPVNAAFQKLPPGAAESIMRPEGKAELTQLLTQHVVPGVVTASDLEAAIERGGGKAQLATVGGTTLTVNRADGGLAVTDPRGGQARISAADQAQSNGVIHSIDAVLMPKQG